MVDTIDLRNIPSETAASHRPATRSVRPDAYPWTPLSSLDVYDTANLAHCDAVGRGAHSIAYGAPDIADSAGPALRSAGCKRSDSASVASAAAVNAVILGGGHSAGPVGEIGISSSAIPDPNCGRALRPSRPRQVAVSAAARAGIRCPAAGPPERSPLFASLGIPHP